MISQKHLLLDYRPADQPWPEGLVIVTGDLKAEALHRGLSLAGVATRSGCDKRTIYRAARGRAIQLRTLCRVLVVLEEAPLLVGEAR
jgi:hypothetical protein